MIRSRPDRDGRLLEGQVVEVCQPALTSPDGSETANQPRPSLGRAVASAPGRPRHYSVHLFSEGKTVVLPEQSLSHHIQAAPEDGGFDLAWPSEVAGLPDFSFDMSEVLESKGWCLVQLVSSEASRLEAVREAHAFRQFESLREEFVSDYMGHGRRGKAGFLETDHYDAVGKAHHSALATFDTDATSLANVLAGISWDTMGFRCHGDRTRAMLRLPYASVSEEEALRPEPLNDDDVEEGKVEEHILFLKQRKLGLMTWLEQEGGQITLTPGPGRHEQQVTLPLSAHKLLVYRSDRMTFEFQPEGRFVMLQTWILEPAPRFELQSIEGDASSKAEAMGIFSGRPYPEGDHVHIMSAMTRLPGGGFGPEQYWAMLLDGTDGELPIPALRWDTEVYCTKEDEPRVFGKCYARHGGFCAHEDIYTFDNKFFDISDDEAWFMSPSQRIVLEDGYTVLFRGGHTQATLSGNSVGFFLGDTGSDWNPFNPARHLISSGGLGEVVTSTGVHSTSVSGSNNSVTASRLSHALNLVGPAATADTACSSSLVATGVAMSWLRPRMSASAHTGRLSEAVAGGVCTQIGPGSYIAMCGLNMISPAGRCFTFDESGDGYARGEGCGMIYLKASDHEKDMFDQLACILGCAVNQDGRSASMTAPNGPSQQTCILASMREAGNEARDINLAECHGTGTALGDPIEVGALRNVMEPRSSPLALTSSKSNLGHLEGCAGIAGLLKCVMMLLAGVCPPNCHLWQLNPHLSVDGFPCHFETEAVDSNLNSSLTGVSSFGFGGTNGRCDVWGHARSGVRKAGKLNPQELDQIYAICPVTLGRIDYITGEPVVNRRAGHRRKHRADVLRDDFASYELSRYVYDGGFRYRRRDLPLEQEAEDLEPDSSVFICGSWSGFREMEEMERNGAGMFSAQIVLGEGRYELFELCINRSQELAIYPTIDRASQILCVEGPDANGRGRRWLIDGRDAQVPAGTVFHVTFKWGQDRKELSWNQVSETRLGMALPHRHTYYVVGSFSHPERRLTALSLADDGSDSWEGAFRIGPKGHEEFQFLRDGDLQQAVYPAMPKAASGNDSASWTTLASLARGPDELGKNRHFLVRGVPGEQVRLRLSVVDAEVIVTATCAASAGSPREWRSLSGWARHQYSVVGSSNDGLHIPMVMDPSRPGVFTSVVTMREVFSEEQAAFCDTFQVAVDYDKHLVFYPEVPGSSSGEAIVLRPDAKAVGSEHVFVVRSRTPGRTFQVTLDLTAEDRRQTVSWAWVDRPKRDRFQGLAGVAASV